jgi:hypothetical protein
MQINWIADQLYCYPEVEGETDVIFKVDYQVFAQDGEYKAQIWRNIELTYVAGGTFIPYNQLTNDIVIGWIQTQLGEEQVTNYNNLVTQNVNAQKPTNVVTPPLPWVS